MKKKQRLPNIAQVAADNAAGLYKVIPEAWAVAADEVYPYSVHFSLEQELNCINLRKGFKEGYLSREEEISQLREVLQDCAEVLNLLASRAGIQTEDAALKSDEEDYGALAALRAAREILNNQNKTA